MKKKLLFLIVATIAVGTIFTFTLAPAIAAGKNDPGVFDQPVKSVVKISSAFGEGLLIRHITGHASTKGRAHAQGALLGSAFGVANSVFDCAVATKCTTRQFLTDAAIASITGGGLGYTISTIGGGSPLFWSGVVGAAGGAVDEFVVNPAIYK